MELELKIPLPENRTYEQVKNHYLVEKAIAKKLMRANREERKAIYMNMYDELFAKVPDHPRLTRRSSEALTLDANREKFGLLKPFLDQSKTFVEFACGDCRFSEELSKHVKYLYGIDICDQGGDNWTPPDNFELIVYDGYNLNLEDECVDVVFSDQLIEHIHPEDTIDHFRLVNRILKQGGNYVFRMPHLYSGPHDVSKYFSYEPEGFHLKEWTYSELIPVLKKMNFSKFSAFRVTKGINFRLPLFYFLFCEQFIKLLPLSKATSRKLFHLLVPNIFIAAVK